MTTTTFWQDDRGAVTVDWVVLTGGLVGLGLAAMSVVSGGVQNNATDTASTLSSSIIVTSFKADAQNLDFSSSMSGVYRSWGFETYDLPGWDDAGGVKMINVASAGNYGADYQYMVALRNFSGDNSGISQELQNVQVGKEYTVSFDATTVPGQNESFEVFFGGQSLGEYTVDSSVDAYELTFTGGAGDGSNELSFVQTSNTLVNGNLANGAMIGGITIE